MENIYSVERLTEILGSRFLACSPKTGPVIMQIVQLAETRERLHAKANQP